MERPEDKLPPYLGYTTGSAIVFPGIQIDGKQVINQARGFNRKISDRFDLTLECIRRHYVLKDLNPLGDVLNRYGELFALFGNFDGYVEFFLLQDLVEDDGVNIKYSHTFKNFTTPAVPQDEGPYLEYLWRTNEFIAARNARIDREP